MWIRLQLWFFLLKLWDLVKIVKFVNKGAWIWGWWLWSLNGWWWQWWCFAADKRLNLWYCVGLCRKSTLHVYSPKKKKHGYAAYIWYETLEVLPYKFVPTLCTRVRQESSPSSLALVTLCTTSTASSPPSDTLLRQIKKYAGGKNTNKNSALGPKIEMKIPIVKKIIKYQQYKNLNKYKKLEVCDF